MGLHMVPVEVMTTFATPFAALPHPNTHPILDPQGAVVPIDIYDPAQWRQRHWGVYAPEVMQRVRASAVGAEAGERAVAELHATFERNLARGKRMQLALSAPFPAEGVQLITFGGDCEVTPGHGVLLPEAYGGRLVFRPGQVPAGARKAAGDVDYDKLMLEPGDGLVTRSSQTARRPLGVASEDLHMLPVRGSFFLCESHGRLTHNLYFQDNLLYFLLSR
jgi:hypothetical protein